MKMYLLTLERERREEVEEGGGRGGEGSGKKHPHERETRIISPLTGYQTCNLGRYHDQD